MAAIKISEGFNLGYCRARPGKGPMLHNHDTNETFIAMTGTWRALWENERGRLEHVDLKPLEPAALGFPERAPGSGDRKSTRLNSSHSQISYAVFCLEKKK